jgi:GT2 family glycosyltransferase
MTFLDDITAIVVNYNSGQIIDNCLARVSALKETIVVDNASQDDSLAAIERTYPKATIVRNSRNLGFGAGVNRGIEKVSTPYLLTISPDAEIEMGALRKMYEAIKSDERIAVVTPALEVPGHGMQTWVMGPNEMIHRLADFSAEGAFCTWFSSAAVALYRTEALRKISGFDENIFLYNEDLDLSLRFSEAKYAMVTLPDVTARHINSGSAQPSVKLHWRKDWNFSWGHLYLIRKHIGRAAAVFQALRTIALRAPKALLYILTFDRKRMIRDGATTMGAVSFLLGRKPNPRD